MKRKLFVIIASFLCSAGIWATTYSGSCGNLTWTFNDATGKISFSGTGAMPDYASASAAPWYQYRSSITNAYFRSTITRIGNHAFEKYTALTEISFDYANVDITYSDFNDNQGYGSGFMVNDKGAHIVVGEYAFAGCTALQAIKSYMTEPQIYTYEDGIRTYYGGYRTYFDIDDGWDETDYYYAPFTAVENYAFQNTKISVTGLKTQLYGTWVGDNFYSEVDVPYVTIGDYAYDNCSNLLSAPYKTDYIGTYAFAYCSSLTNIPTEMTGSVGCYAFGSCTSLTSITIPSTITDFCSNAFTNCTSLTSVNIDDLDFWYNISFTSAASNPLYYAHKLYLNNQLVTDITIPNTVTTISDYAFYNCTSIKNVTIPSSVTSIGAWAFYKCNNISSFTIPNSITTIGDGAFNSCIGLTSVTIPNSVTNLGYSTFDGCSSLTSVTMPNGITTIGNQEFKDCISLSSITIPTGVTSIGYEAFYNCYAFTSITIPASVTSIGFSAFEGCSNITSVTCFAQVPPTIKDQTTFKGDPTSIPVYVPFGCATSYKNATGWANFTNYIELPRSVESSEVGTVCLQQAVAAGDFSGASFYSIAGKRVDATGAPTSIVLEEVTSLEAGMPYIFIASGSELSVTYNGDAVTTAKDYHGLHGTFSDFAFSNDQTNYTAENAITNGGYYVIVDNTITKASSASGVYANRAFIKMSEVPDYSESSSPARIIEMSLDGQIATGISAAETQSNVQKIVRDNQILILKDGVYYNLSGQMVK